MTPYGPDEAAVLERLEELVLWTRENLSPADRAITLMRLDDIIYSLSRVLVALKS